MRTGLIFRCLENEIPPQKDWNPVPLGGKKAITEIVQRVVNTAGKECETESGEKVCRFNIDSISSYLEVDIPADEEIPCLVVRGIFSDDARIALHSLCAALHARYYDSESGFENP